MKELEQADTLFTVARLAYLFSVHRQTVRRWICKGRYGHKLPAHRSQRDGHFRILASDLGQFVVDSDGE